MELEGMNVKAHAKSTIVGTALGALLLAGALAGCASDGLALHAATTPTPNGALSNAAPGGATVAGTGAIARGQVASAQPLPGVAAVAPAAVNASVAVAPLPQTATGAPMRGISVNGTGRVEARPDQAIVQAGVSTRAQTAQQAQADNNQAMQSVINAIKGLGIPDKDVQTSGVSLYPVITENNTVSGYNATNSVSVTVENVDQAGAVLDAAIKAGANTASGIRFGFKDETALRNRALAAAAADARSKADALAAALGLQISGVQAVSEGQVNIPIPLASPRAASAAQAAPSVPIEPGEQTITAEITIVFSY